jgi:hypothetical protein
MAEEVEVNPDVGAAAFGTPKDGAVEVARGSEVIDRKGDMKGAQRHS